MRWSVPCRLSATGEDVCEADEPLCSSTTGFHCRQVPRTSSLARYEQDGRRDHGFRPLHLLLRLATSRDGAYCTFLGELLALHYLIYATDDETIMQMPRYLLATTLAALLEASSAQNDNLIMCVEPPTALWSTR